MADDAEYNGSGIQYNETVLETQDDEDPEDWEPIFDKTGSVALYMADQVEPTVKTIHDALAAEESEKSEEQIAQAFEDVGDLKDGVERVYAELEEVEVPYDGLEDEGLLADAVIEATFEDIESTIGSTSAKDYKQMAQRVVEYRERFEAAYEEAEEQELTAPAQ